MTNPNVMQGTSDDWNTAATKTALAAGELENQLRTLDATRHGLNTAVRSQHTGTAIDSTLADLHTSGTNLWRELDRIQTQIQKRGGQVDYDDLDAAQKVMAHDGSDGVLNATDGSGPASSGKISLSSLT
ncbi:hypothetical protein ACFYU5_20745 [Nocardia aobensis]|uniref:Uncharacterized protein n=1 Tax=Nocardia aobensis TaxID=257277 RepID=A0ABW6P6T1_9NOCA|nr:MULTISPECIES: hypothetical protein [Nocardia]MBF6149181.1 hypothetical protein [Nocardia nova]MDN2498205.1 hypothetical protein [Nocardia nova]PSR68422.1 hypothetical protein C8258_11540 [Nocardia sp. MDA0666]